MPSVSNQKGPSCTLPFHEKAVALLLMLVFLLATAVNLYHDSGEMPSVADPAQTVEPYIEISITGAVRKPGNYQVPKGTLTIDAIKMAEPLEDANLKKINNHSKILRRRNIHIKSSTRTNR